MTTSSASTKVDPQLDLVRGIVEFAASRNWSIRPDDVLDVLWLAGSHSEGGNFESRRRPKVSSNPPELIDDKGSPKNGPEPKPVPPPVPQPKVDPSPAPKYFEILPRPPISETASVVSLPAPPAFPNERKFLQALRPVFTRGPSRLRKKLDVAATIRQLVDEGIWDVKEQPVDERQVEVTLILDHSSSMDMWRSVLKDVQRSLHSSGAFRRVDVAFLSSRGDSVSLIEASSKKLHRTLSMDQKAPRSLRSRLCLVATDCVSRLWHLKGWSDLLDKWSQTTTIAILQVLPEYQWRRTVLARAERLRATTTHWLAPNQQFRKIDEGFKEYHQLFGSEKIDHAKTLLPIANLFDERSVQALSRFLAARAGTVSTCYQLMRSADPPPVTRRAPLEALKLFRMRASHAAHRLATLLAAAPAISLPITRIVQKTHMPDDGGPHIEAEVWLGGLLERIEETASDDPEAVLYTFRAGIREELLDGLTASLSRQILDSTSKYIEENLGRLGGFRGYLRSPEKHQAALDAGPGSDPIARVAAQILRRQPNKFAEIAKNFIGDESEFSSPPSSSRRILFSREDVCTRFAWSPDGRLLAIPLRSGTLCLLDMRTGKTIHDGISGGGLNEATWSSDGERVAVACYHRSVKVFDRDLKKQGKLSEHHSDVTAAVFSPHPDILASGTANGTVRIWSASRQSLIARRNSQQGPVRAICWLDESNIAVGYAEQTLLLQYHKGEISIAVRFGVGSTSLVYFRHSGAWLAAERVLALGRSNGCIKFWDVNAGKWLPDLYPHRAWITSLSVSKDSSLLASKSNDGTVAVTSLLTGQILRQWTTDRASNLSSSIAFLPGEDQLAVAESSDSQIVRYDLRDVAPVIRPPPVPAVSYRVRIAGSLPTGAKLEKQFQRACYEIGGELARRGHVLVISSASLETADYHAFLGYVEAQTNGTVVFARHDDQYAHDLAKRLKGLIPREHKTLDRKDLLSIVDSMFNAPNRNDFIDVVRRHLERELPSWSGEESELAEAFVSHFQSAANWRQLQNIVAGLSRANPVVQEILGRFGSPAVKFVLELTSEEPWSSAQETKILESCNAAILIGGKSHTRTVWIAAARKIPALPVGCFGGTVRAILKESKELLISAGFDPKVLHLLNTEWTSSHATRTVECVEHAIAEQPTRPDPILPPARTLPAGFAHILWVDDRPNNNSEVRRMFEFAGLRFTLALSTYEGLDALRQFRFSAIISDMGRPEGPRAGYELLDSIRKEGNQTPLIFYAASNSPAHKQETLRHGGQGCTNNMPELVQLVAENVLNGYYQATGGSSQNFAAFDPHRLKSALELIREKHVLWRAPSISPLMHLESAVTIEDEALNFGRWVTTRETHTIGPIPAFRLGVQTITNTEFFQFVKSGGYEQQSLWSSQASPAHFLSGDGRSLGPSTWKDSKTIPEGKEFHPVTGISYFEAEAYCRWLNQVAPQHGWNWQLPTEDMWELAARLRHRSHATRYPWGDRFEPGRCNCVSERRSGTSVVGDFASGNTLDGCSDLAGNVWEFVDSPKREETCLLRGGSFVNTGEEVRSDLRLWGVRRDLRAHDFGFRCALCRSDAAHTERSAAKALPKKKRSDLRKKTKKHAARSRNVKKDTTPKKKK